MQNNSDQNSIRLRVKQERKREKKKKYVRIHPEMMKKLRIVAGGIVSIKGKKETTASVWPILHPTDDDLDIISMNSRFRINTETEIGDYVELKRVFYSFAREIVLAPISGKLDPNSLAPLINYPVCIGDFIFWQTRSISTLVFQVAELDPPDICIEIS